MNPVVAALVGIDMPYMNTNSKRKHGTIETLLILKVKTGFHSENDMLAYIGVACNGDVKKLWKQYVYQFLSGTKDGVSTLRNEVVG